MLLKGGLDRAPIRAALLGQQQGLAIEVLCEKCSAARQAVAVRHEQRHLLLGLVEIGDANDDPLDAGPVDGEAAVALLEAKVAVASGDHRP